MRHHTDVGIKRYSYLVCDAEGNPLGQRVLDPRSDRSAWVSTPWYWHNLKDPDNRANFHAVIAWGLLELEF